MKAPIRQVRQAISEFRSSPSLAPLPHVYPCFRPILASRSYFFRALSLRPCLTLALALRP